MSRFAVVAVALVGCLSFVSHSFAQIIYEPVRYQYSAGGSLYYYGGTDARIHREAASPVGPARSWGRVNGWDFASGDIDHHREVVPAQAPYTGSDRATGTIEIKPYAGPRATSRPRPVLIFPKDLLDRPAAPAAPSEKRMASAN